MVGYILVFIVSLAILIFASDWFIGAAEKIGLSFGISPFVIGVTIVAFGTSLPELAASIAGVLQGESSVVIGNVIGSNITNILLVLGLTAIIGKSIKMDFDVMQTDMPLLFASAFMLYFMLLDLNISIVEALILLLALVIFLANSVKNSETSEEDQVKAKPIEYLKLILGGVFIYLGAKYTLSAMIDISESLGVSPYVLGVTAVALGTSLPEVVVSIAAARRNQHAIAVGNVLGSNIFNTFAVVGIPSLIDRIEIPQSTLDFSAPFMVAMTVMFGMVCISKKISKWEGMILVLFYVFFIGYMVEHAAM